MLFSLISFAVLCVAANSASAERIQIQTLDDFAKHAMTSGQFEPAKVKTNTLLFTYDDKCENHPLIEQVTRLAPILLYGVQPPIFFNHYGKSRTIVEHFGVDMSFDVCIRLLWIRKGWFPRVFQYVPGVSEPFEEWFSGVKLEVGVTFTVDAHTPGALMFVHPNGTEVVQAQQNENIKSQLGIKFRTRSPEGFLIREDVLEDHNIQIYSGYSPVRLFTKAHFTENILGDDHWFTEEDSPKASVIVFYDQASKATARLTTRALRKVFDPLYVRIAYYDLDTGDRGKLTDWLNITRYSPEAKSEKCEVQDGKKMGRGRPVIGFVPRHATIGEEGIEGMTYFVKSEEQCNANPKDVVVPNDVVNWAMSQAYVKMEIINYRDFEVSLDLEFKPNAADFRLKHLMDAGNMPEMTSLTIDCSIGDKIHAKKAGTDEVVGSYVVLGHRTVYLAEALHGIDEPANWEEMSRWVVDRDQIRQLNFHYVNNLDRIAYYDEVGFKKTRVPEDVMPLLRQWVRDSEAGIRDGTIEPHNMHWQHLNANTAFMTGLTPSEELSAQVSEMVKPIIEDFMQTPLKFSVMSMHIYNNNSVVAPHVDNPYHHVVGVIMNVENDTEEPWMLQVVDHVGKTHTMPTYPGDMVIYEAATITHSRPFHMNGKQVSNAFLHYQPLHWAVSDYAHWDEPYNNLERVVEALPPAASAASAASAAV